MELIEIKEIIRKASVEVDIQGYGKHIALFETDFERVVIEIVKKLTLTDVSQQSELLLSAICQFTKRNTQKEIQEVEKWIETDFRK